MRGKEKGRAPHPFLMRLKAAPIGAPPPFFQGRSYLATLFGLAFLGVSKTRVRSGIARTDMRMSQKDIFQRTSGHFQRTSGYGAATTHAKLSGPAHSRRVAGGAITRAQRFDPARAVRFAGIVSDLKDIRLWRGDDSREAFRAGSLSKSGWRAHYACATI